MDIPAALATISGALTVAKSMRDIDKEYDAATFKARIAELIDALTDAKISLADAKEIIAQRDKEVERLLASIADRSTLQVGVGGYKYRKNDAGAMEGFPVCPKCEQVDGRLIGLVQDGDVVVAKCPACASSFKPVTCYLSGGNGTLKEQRDERLRRMSEEQTRKMRDAFG